jgi:hypothetical protein
MTITLDTTEAVEAAHKDAAEALVAEFGGLSAVPRDRWDELHEITRRAHEAIVEARKAAETAEARAERAAAKKAERDQLKADREAERAEKKRLAAEAKAEAKAEAPKRKPGRPRKAEAPKPEKQPWPCATEGCDNLIHPTGKRGRPAKKCESCRSKK